MKHLNSAFRVLYYNIPHILSNKSTFIFLKSLEESSIDGNKRLFKEDLRIVSVMSDQKVRFDDETKHEMENIDDQNVF